MAGGGVPPPRVVRSRCARNCLCAPQTYRSRSSACHSTFGSSCSSSRSTRQATKSRIRVRSSRSSDSCPCCTQSSPSHSSSSSRRTRQSRWTGCTGMPSPGTPGYNCTPSDCTSGRSGARAMRTRWLRRWARRERPPSAAVSEWRSWAFAPAWARGSGGTEEGERCRELVYGCIAERVDAHPTSGSPVLAPPQLLLRGEGFLRNFTGRRRHRFAVRCERMARADSHTHTTCLNRVFKDLAWKCNLVRCLRARAGKLNAEHYPSLEGLSIV